VNFFCTFVLELWTFGYETDRQTDRQTDRLNKIIWGIKLNDACFMIVIHVFVILNTQKSNSTSAIS